MKKLYLINVPDGYRLAENIDAYHDNPYDHIGIRIKEINIPDDDTLIDTIFEKCDHMIGSDSTMNVDDVIKSIIKISLKEFKNKIIP